MKANDFFSTFYDILSLLFIYSYLCEAILFETLRASRLAVLRKDRQKTAQEKKRTDTLQKKKKKIEQTLNKFERIPFFEP